MRNARLIIAITLITLYNTFGYGQVQLEPACAESVEVYGVTGFDDSEFVWSVEGGVIIDGDGTDTVTIRWGYNTGMRQIEVMEITKGNCNSLPSLADVEVMAPPVDLGYDFPEICDEDNMIFDVGEHYQQPFEVLWHDGSNDPVYVTGQAEEIWVRIIDGFGCIRYDTVTLSVNTLPEVDLGPDDTIFCDLGEFMELNAGDDFAEYSWYRSSNTEENLTENPIYLEPGSVLDTIRVTVTDFKGCNMADTILFLPCDVSFLFKDMSNTFTPDGDGVNDIWNIVHIDLFEEAVLEIFDRWGRIVYRTDDPVNQPWDGKSKGKDMPMDSYYYVIELNVADTPPLTGTVNLIR